MHLLLGAALFAQLLEHCPLSGRLGALRLQVGVARGHMALRVLQALGERVARRLEFLHAPARFVRLPLESRRLSESVRGKKLVRVLELANRIDKQKHEHDTSNG